MESEPAAGIDALLAHRAWVRSLARILVADGAAAEDLEQQAWLEAITRPPRLGGSLRAWFATVLRRRAADARRERWRRTRREEEAARPEAWRATADVVAEAEAHRRVVDAVLALEEPYRETVLLRFFEDLPPREVAVRQSVPVETVRTRTRRALERLREQLDEAHGGDRGLWVAALVPLAGFRAGVGAGAAGAAGTGTATLAGGALMGTKAMVVAAGAAAGVGLLGGVLLMAPRGRSPELEEARVEVRDLRERLERLESRPAAPAAVPAPAPASPPAPLPGPDPAIQQRLAAQDRRIANLELSLAEARAKPREVPPGEESPEQRAERERREREAVERLAKGKKAIAELQSQVDELRRQALDRSLAEADRISALSKLRFLPKGIDRDVVLGMIAFFRESPDGGTRDAILRELHSVVDADLKALFLEALRSDPEERVRERAARDIDTWIHDDRDVVEALGAAKDGDASKRVRDAAAKTLDALRKEPWK